MTHAYAANIISHEQRVNPTHRFNRKSPSTAFTAGASANRLRRGILLAVPLSTLLWIAFAVGLICAFR